MAAIDDISKASRELTPDQIRERLQDMEREERILRALLRAAVRSQGKSTRKGDQQ